MIYGGMSTPIFSWSEHEVPDRAYYLTRQFSQGPYSYRSHTHTGQTELIVVVRGRLEHVLNGRFTALAAGACQWVRETDSHSLRGSGLEFYNLAFPTPSRSWGGLLGSAPENRGGFLASAPVLPPFPFHRLGLGAAEDVLGRLCDRYDPWLFLRLITAALEETTQGAASEGPLGGYVFVEQPGSFEGPRTLASLPSWMAALAGELTRAEALPSAADLPALTGFSAAHVSRSFRRHWGVTPSEYLNRLRLDRAAALLKVPGATSAAVARRVGFADTGYFQKLFRRRFGVAPREFALGNR